MLTETVYAKRNTIYKKYQSSWKPELRISFSSFSRSLVASKHSPVHDTMEIGYRIVTVNTEEVTRQYKHGSHQKPTQKLKRCNKCCTCL